MFYHVRVITSVNLATEKRLAWIKAELDAHGTVRIGPAATELGVSEMTIRRDLQELEATGLARRVRGGAIAVGPVPFADRRRHQARAKARIAVKLLPLVPSSGAIGMDASSTLGRLAAIITGTRDLMVLTNGQQSFQTLQDKPGVRAMLTGGEVDPRTGSLVGPVAARSASLFMLERFFMSAAAVDVELGASEATVEDADVKGAMGGVSREVVLAVDSTKLDSRAVALSLEWSRATFLVTDLDRADPQLDAYRPLVEII